MRPQIVVILTLVLFFMNSFCMLGQATPATSGPPPPNQNFGPELPIDNYILLLVVAGVILGVYFLSKRKPILGNQR